MTNESESDTQIVVQVTNGDIDAYGILIARYETKLLRYVAYLIHDPEITRDVVQETFIKAYRNLRSFNTKYKFSSWIYRIAHNEAMNAVRKNRRNLHIDTESLPDEAYDQRMDEIFDAALLVGQVRDCLRELEPKYREVVRLVYFEHMKYSEVSDVLRIPAATVGVWLSRAKSKLKALCQKKGVRR